MIDLIRHNLDGIRELCERYHVKRLEIFGSASDGRYREGESDLDFIVEFPPMDWEVRGQSFLDLLLALEDLLQHQIDLITLRPQGQANPYFLKEIQKSRQVIYELAGEEVPV